MAYAKGVLEYGNRNYLAALDHLQQVIRLVPDQPDAYFYLGLSFTRIGEFQQAIAALEKVRQLDPSKQYVYYHLGLAYVQAAQYATALTHLERAVTFDPQKAAAYFYLGYCHYQLQQYESALVAFDSALKLEPDLALSVHYYRGRALYALEQDRQARTAFQATIDTDAQSTLGQNAQRYLEAIDRRARDHQLLQVQATIGFQYDDNVTIADDDIISRESDGRTTIAFGGRLYFVRTPQWRLGVAYDLFQSLHFNLDEFNVQQHTGGLVARFKRDRVTLYTTANYTYTTLDNDHFSNAFAIQPSATIRATNTLFTVLSVRYQNDDYVNQFIPPGQEDVRDRDGWRVQPSVAQYLRFNRQRSYLRLRYQFEASRNDGSDWEYDSHQVGLALHSPLLWGITMDIEGTYRRRDYLHINSFDAGLPATLEPGVDRRKRDDDRFTASLLLTREFGRYVQVAVGYFHTSNLSNIGFFEYDRNIWTVSLSGRY